MHVRPEFRSLDKPSHRGSFKCCGHVTHIPTEPQRNANDRSAYHSSLHLSAAVSSNLRAHALATGGGDGKHEQGVEPRQTRKHRRERNREESRTASARRTGTGLRKTDQRTDADPAIWWTLAEMGMQPGFTNRGIELKQKTI